MNEYVHQSRDRLDRKVYCQCPSKTQFKREEGLAIGAGMFLIPGQKAPGVEMDAA